jgi:deoxyribonuclease V
METGNTKGRGVNMYHLPSTISHPWRVSTKEAKEIQLRLSQRVMLTDDFDNIKKILGVGVIYSKAQDEMYVGCVSLTFPGLEILEKAYQKKRLGFPYIPGFFAFSAGPGILSAIKKLKKPDLIMFPGRGIAHPRGLGLASHLGVLLDIPTIACSKTPLWRDYPKLSQDKGACLFVKGEDGKLIGAVVRTRKGKNPVYVSPGHKISVQSAVKIVRQCSPRYRIPEPLRQAHILAKNMSEEGRLGAG